MADLNKYMLIGRLTADPELRRISSGTAVTELRMATSRSYKANDEWKKEVLYIDVVVWGGQAESCCNYLHKGSSVFVEGYLKMDTWDDKNTGEKRSKIRVQAERVQFLDGKPSGDGDQGGFQGEQRRRDDHPQQSRSSHQPQGRGGAPQGRGGGYQGRGTATPVTQAEVDQFQDDDVPF